MKLLVGNTGLIGTTLKDSIKFDYEFNSKNLGDLLKLEIDPNITDIYLCCLPATKWLVNKDPMSDMENIINILGVLSKKQYRNVILYSTIDVYIDAALHSNESSELSISTPSYGYNRLLFEKLVKNTLTYKNLLILRLPALFGKHIKKNILYDLLNNNDIEKINYNSSFQWYNLKNLTFDTERSLESCSQFQIINLFTEPIETKEILSLFGIDKSKVDISSKKIVYDYKTIYRDLGYINSASNILKEINSFIIEYNMSKYKIAVCLFGEPRDIVNRLPHWINFSKNINVDFFVSFYMTEDILSIIDTIKNSINLKSLFICNNDLDYFDSLKYNAKNPIYLYGHDSKATFPRITSQAYIRQKAVSLVDRYEYDAILLSRSDTSNFGISIDDIYKVIKDKNLLLVNSDTHHHPGGGSGCVKCTIESKCDLPYHANDICDLWCIGSTEVMNKWKSFFDNLLEDYNNIQSTTGITDKLEIEERTDKNEVLIKVPINLIPLIENDVHCFYPEKIMRSTFKDVKILGATNDKSIWNNETWNK